MRSGEEAVARSPPRAERRNAPRTLTLSGASLALLFWFHSLTPTLIPRSWEKQAAIGAICLVIGYCIGTLAGRCVERLVALSGRVLDVNRRRSGIILGTAWLAGLVIGAMLWVGWQNEQRNFMGMPTIGWLDGMQMSVLSPAAGVFLVVVGRMMIQGGIALGRLIGKHIPALVWAPAAALLIVVPGAVLAWGEPLRALTAFFNAIHEPVNEQTTEGTMPPESAAVSGSSASLVAWETLGRMGRDFVASAMTAEQLVTFHGTDAELTDPVRVYVGLQSAESLDARAALAVRELERAGGFDRHVLVVWVPTGTGWMIPKAAAALELLHRGDTAIVALQYSFLPSLLAVFFDAGLANEAGIALFDAVRAHWSALPPERRPKLILFGKSLGTAGVEAPFVGIDASASVANMVARTDGVLMAGAKQSNPIRLQLTRERDPGSPVWQPVFDGGRSVRFLNRDPRQPISNAEWTVPRIAYLQHPADPVVFWSIDCVWWPPRWMAEPRGFDVPDATRWFPIVSGVQAVGDLLDQLGPPPGFGHDYSTEYAKGWVSVVPPDTWTEAQTRRLEQFIEYLAGDEPAS